MDGIIFDVDGTLWDSTETVAIAYNKVLEDCAHSTLRVDADMLKKLFGKPMDVIFETLLPDTPRDLRVELAEKCYELEHAELLKAPGEIYPHLQETLEILSKKYPLFIVSNCQCGYIELFLQQSGLGRFFKDHLCFGDTGTSKGQTIRTLMARNDLTSPVYVGDTQGDADACAEAGVPFIYAAYGFGDVENPQRYITSLRDLQFIF